MNPLRKYYSENEFSMGEKHGHHHDHTHHHAPSEDSGKNDERVLIYGVAITLLMATAEAIAGWHAGSLALLGDAGHMLSDATALTVAAVAARLQQRPPTSRHSYGLGRAEAIAALANALLMLFIVVTISLNAIERFVAPQPIAGGTVTLIALLGLGVNGALAWMLHRRGHGSLNVRGAFLHVMADLLGSVAAVTSGLVVWLTGWVPIDPILSLAICALIVWSAWQLLRESVLVMMEGVPKHLNLTEVGKTMAGVAGVYSIHDLHIWTLSSGSVALSAHLVLRDLRQWEAVLQNMQSLLRDRFQINHVTLQPECPTFVVHPPKIPRNITAD